MGPKQDWRIDPIVLLLFTGLLVTLGAAVAIALRVPQAVALLLFVTGLCTGFMNAMMLRINPDSMKKQDKDGAKDPTAEPAQLPETTEPKKG